MCEEDTLNSVPQIIRSNFRSGEKKKWKIFRTTKFILFFFCKVEPANIVGFFPAKKLEFSFSRSLGFIFKNENYLEFLVENDAKLKL